MKIAHEQRARKRNHVVTSGGSEMNIPLILPVSPPPTLTHTRPGIYSHRRIIRDVYSGWTFSLPVTFDVPLLLLFRMLLHRLDSLSDSGDDV